MKTKKTEIQEVRDKITNDSDLKHAGRLLSYTALVCIALALGGATIHKANTFLFEIEFNNPMGLKLLLLAVLFVLLAKYHSNAFVHFKSLEEIELDRLLENPEVYLYDGIDTHRTYGLLGDVVAALHNDYPPYSAIDIEYKRKLFFRRYITFTKREHADDQEDTIVGIWNDKVDLYNPSWNGLKPRKYIRLLWLDFKNRINCWLNYPEHLSLLLPYIAGCVAIVSIAIAILAPDVLTKLYASILTIGVR